MDALCLSLSFSAPPGPCSALSLSHNLNGISFVATTNHSGLLQNVTNLSGQDHQRLFFLPFQYQYLSGDFVLNFRMELSLPV